MVMVMVQVIVLVLVLELAPVLVHLQLFLAYNLISCCLV